MNGGDDGSVCGANLVKNAPRGLHGVERHVLIGNDIVVDKAFGYKALPNVAPCSRVEAYLVSGGGDGVDVQVRHG